MKYVNFTDFKNIKRMSLNEFNKWIEEIYKGGYDDGTNFGEFWSDEEILELLLSENIDEEKANKIIDKLFNN